ncbi:site-specific integrase [Streptomyces anthocyanicus]|uniref:site-specific integrase n=1 Tax=Streptomyces anthocyanicus TaxID=68174 RepID=UPI00362CEA23
MDLFFVSRDRVQRWPALFDGLGTEAVGLLDHRALPDGLPMILDTGLRPVEPACMWFRHLAYMGRDPEGTLRPYAYIVLRLMEFLAERGRELSTATESDLVAYRRSRVELQDQPVGGAAWDREASVINSLFGWLVEQGFRQVGPLRMGNRNGSSSGSRLPRENRNPLSSGMSRDMDIRHLSLDQYRFFRDVGLGGQRLDGSVDRGFRGWAPHRNRAAADLALTSGMRLQEWSTVLLPELAVGMRRAGEPIEFVLQACAKYKKRRTAYVPPDALGSIDTFVLLERPEIVAPMARALERRHRELLVVFEIDYARGRLRAQWRGRSREFAWSAMTPKLRRLAVYEGPHGLEPLAVFVGHGSTLLSSSSWDRIRHMAWDRMTAVRDDSRAPMLPVKRWRFHDLRHTFALRLLAFLMRRAMERDAAIRGGRSVAAHIAFNPLLIVSRRLGHSSPAVTYEYLRYLEEPMQYVDAAFTEWSASDGDTYADIALRALGTEAGHAEAR